MASSFRFLAPLVVLPAAFRFRNVRRLPLFRSSGKEDNQLVAVVSEINAVAGTEIHPPLKDPRANSLRVAEVSLRNAVEGGCDFRGSDRVC